MDTGLTWPPDSAWRGDVGNACLYYYKLHTLHLNTNITQELCSNMLFKTIFFHTPSCSIFILSNESVNIWSHLLGFILFFFLGLNDLSAILPAAGANREDYIIYAIGLFCFQVTTSGLFIFRHWWAKVMTFACFAGFFFFASFKQLIHFSLCLRCRFTQLHRLRSVSFMTAGSWDALLEIWKCNSSV